MRSETPYFQVPSFFFLRRGPGSNPRPKPAAVQTPRQLHPISGRTLCRRAPNAHSALQPASRSVRMPHRAGRTGIRGVRGPRQHPRGSCPHTPHPLGRSTAGGRGRGYPVDAHVAIAGGGPEPQPPAGRKPAAAAAPRTRARGPRAREAWQERRQWQAGLSPPVDGGRRDPGSGRRGRGGGSYPAAGSRPRAGQAARAAARPRKGYLLHGSLDGGVWGLGLLQQLQDLLKPLLVRFPLILHLGLLQIKPDTGRDGANVTPRAQARGLPAPSNPHLPARTTPALPRRLGPVWGSLKKSRTLKPGGTDPGSWAANVC